MDVKKFSNVEGKVCSDPDGGLPSNVFEVRYWDLARALARRQYTVPLRIMNLSESSKTIHPCTIVDELSQVEDRLIGSRTFNNLTS